MRSFLMQCIKVYRIFSLVIHSFVGVFGVRTQCKFPESCSCYAVRQLSDRNQSVIKAAQRIALRLMMCSPLYGVLVKE